MLRDAVEELQARAGEDDPRLLALLYWSGMVALAQGDGARAVEALRRAREVVGSGEPLSIAALDGTLARALLDQPAQVAEAAALAGGCFGPTPRPTDAAALYVLARIAFARQQLDEARNHLRRALASEAIDGNWARPACSLLLGEILVLRGNAGDGCPMLTSALARARASARDRNTPTSAPRTRTSSKTKSWRLPRPSAGRREQTLARAPQCTTRERIVSCSAAGAATSPRNSRRLRRNR